MKANIHCVCQSRMHVSNGKAVCKNGACKYFEVEFQAPNLELQEVAKAQPETESAAVGQEAQSTQD